MASVSPNPAAKRASKLVSPERRNRPLIKEVPRIQIAVSQKFEKTAVELIGSGLRHNVNLRPGSRHPVSRAVPTGASGFRLKFYLVCESAHTPS